MLPHAHNEPALLEQLRVRISVPAAVRFDLLPPPIGVLLRPRTVLRTPVPETTVDEYSDAQPREGDVRATTEAWQSVVDSEAKAVPVKKRSDCSLGSSVALTLGLHPLKGVG